MKKSKLFLTLALLAPTFSMTSCAKELTATYYGVDKGANTGYGDTICKIDVKVFDGKISSASIEETYSPNLWARVSDTDATTLGADAVLSVTNSNTTIKFAKYISINDVVWTGTVRDNSSEAAYWNRGEYVRYYQATSEGKEPSDDNATYDLMGRYCTLTDAGTYKLGENSKAYYNAVVDGKIKIYKSATEASTVSPYFIESKKIRSEVSTSTNWNRAINALSTYFAGKQLNYSSRVTYKLTGYDTIKAIDGVWNYNAEICNYDSEDKALKNLVGDDHYKKIDGCNSSDISYDSMDTIFYGTNQAFASVEYDSIS